jgi:hypothetical protein
VTDKWSLLTLLACLLSSVMDIIATIVVAEHFVTVIFLTETCEILSNLFIFFDLTL